MTDAVKRILLYSVLVVALCGFFYVQGKAAATNELTIDKAQALLGGHKGYARSLDSLVAIAHRDSAHADSLAKHPQYVTIVTAHHDTVTTLDTVWVAQEVTSLRGAYTACSEGLTRCRARGDSLEATLAAVLKVKTCHLLFLPCPSRGAIFLLGAVGGAVLENRLTH